MVVHESCKAVVFDFGKYGATRATLYAVASTPAGRSYLAWMVRKGTFCGPWNHYAKAALTGQPVVVPTTTTKGGHRWQP